MAAYSHDNPGVYFELAGDFYRQMNTFILATFNTAAPTNAEANSDLLTIPGKELIFTDDILFAVCSDSVPSLWIYYGQRPWRVRQGVGAPLDPRLEHVVKLTLEVFSSTTRVASMRFLIL